MKVAVCLFIIAVSIVGCTSGVGAFGLGKLGSRFSNAGSISAKLKPFVPPVVCGNGTLDFTTGCAGPLPGGI